MKNNEFFILILILALIYIISPVDVVPDPIPVVGWVDDVVVGLGATAVCAKSQGKTDK